MSASSDVIVVGGGHNGLVAASYLARAGMNVLVLERRSILGGACVTEELFPGFHFSSASFLLYAMRPKIVRDMQLHRHGLEVFAVEPHEFRPLPDGRHLVLWGDPDRNAEGISAFSKHDARAYVRWVEFWRRADEIVAPFVLSMPPSLTELSRRADDLGYADVFETLLTTSLRDMLDAFFESETIKGVFASARGDPYELGSTYLGPHALDEAGEGNLVGIVKGGMGAITRAMVAFAKSQGAQIRTEVEVRRIVVAEGRVRGVELANGERIHADIVLSNADPKRTFLGLVNPQHLPGDFVEQVQRLKTECACLKFHATMNQLPDFSAHLGADHDPKILARVWISPSVEHVHRAWRDAAAGEPSRKPTMSLQIPSVYDASICPEGKHVLSIFAEFAPYRLARGTWDERREEVGNHLIDEVTRYAPNFRKAIDDWMLFTPLDIERRFSMTAGNIFHLDMSPGQLFSRRPLPGWAQYKTPIGGLWMCGSGTHPGGEVSGAPGHNAAHAILDELDK